MLAIERAYEWIKAKAQNEPDEYEKLKNNVDEATATIRRIFRDASIRKENVELLFTDKSDFEKKTGILEAELSKINAQISELKNKADTISSQLETLNIINGKNYNARKDRSDLRQRMEKTRLLEVERIENMKKTIAKQNELFAKEFGTVAIETDEKPKKRKSSVVKENGSN